MSDIVLPRRSGVWPLALAPALCAGLAVAVGIAALARLDRAGPPPATAAAAPPPIAAPPPSWLEIPRPVRIYSLEAPELRRTSLVYAARRLALGDAREDRLAFGAADGTPMLRLSVRRGTAGTPPRLDAVLSALLAADGLQAKLAGNPSPLATRFGIFEAAAATRDGVVGSACHVFRLAVRDPALAIAGLSCAKAAAPLSGTALACLIDRLDLASAGEDRALATFFAAAELRRNAACSGMRLGPDGLHAPWLDDKPATPPAKTRRHAGLIRPAQVT